RWSNGSLSFRWYHYIIYTGVGFLLLPLCILVKNAIRAWSVDRKQFEDEESRDTKYVIVIESLVEGILQFGLQVLFMVTAEPPFALAWYRWVSIFTSLLSAARGASLLLELKGIPTNLVYLFIIIAVRIIAFALTGNLADHMHSYDGINILLSYVIIYVSASIVPMLVILKKELPSRDAGHILWTFFRVVYGHYILDIVTPYGLAYSVAHSLFVLMSYLYQWEPLFLQGDPFLMNEVYRYTTYCKVVDIPTDISKPCQDVDITFYIYGLVYVNMVISITQLIASVIMVVLAKNRYGNIGKSIRNIWDVLDI
ncbi:unnamed protein product, partial [Meganyctiphanes norvegica]